MIFEAVTAHSPGSLRINSMQAYKSSVAGSEALSRRGRNMSIYCET